MAQEIFFLILGAILGTIFNFIPKWYRSLIKLLNSKKAQNRKVFLENNSAIYDWLIQYYTENSNDLFNCRIANYEIKIPFLTKPEWLYYSPMPQNDDILLDYTETNNQKFPIETNLIRMRKELGQVLFDNPALYLDRIEENESSLTLHVKSCDYFQIASSFISLEEETFKAVQKNSYKHLKIRDSYISRVSQVQGLIKKPFAIGCAVALALKTKDSYELLIHTRSHAAVTFGGAKGVTPNFGLAPLTGGVRTIFSDSDFSLGSNRGYNLLYYNFIKEFLEELYNYEELIELVSNRKANPFWFYNLHEAEKLLHLIEQGSFSLEFLGFGFDALNGNAIIALLGVINEEKYSVELKNNLELNWEIAKKKDVLAFEFVDIKSDKLERWLRDNKYHTGAAFTISRALKRLNAPNAFTTPSV